MESTTGADLGFSEKGVKPNSKSLAKGLVTLPLEAIGSLQLVIELPNLKFRAQNGF